MRKISKISGALLVGAGLLLSSMTAQAEPGRAGLGDFTLRLEPGVAIPATAPQNERFHVGGHLAIKPEFALGSYFSVGPSISGLALPSAISGIDTGTALMLGGFGRVKRPHDSKNTDTGFAAVSPWLDADLQYVRTGPLDRFGWAIAVGASVPTSDARHLWVGPFIRYQTVYQEDRPNFNTNDAKIVILGLSLELGAKAEKKSEVALLPPVEQPPTPAPAPAPQPVPPPSYHDVDKEQQAVVQFAWDSPVLDTAANTALAGVVKKLASAKSFKSIMVEGHASSEGQVEHNNVLSLHRAQAVVDYLVANGIPREKISAVGFGSRVPVATNSTEAGRVLNRRAEFVIKFVVVEEGK
jgi:OOP family OmpA-OmpF porin